MIDHQGEDAAAVFWLMILMLVLLLGWGFVGATAAARPVGLMLEILP